jgi:hypothetical protein
MIMYFISVLSSPFGRSGRPVLDILARISPTVIPTGRPPWARPIRDPARALTTSDGTGPPRRFLLTTVVRPRHLDLSLCADELLHPGGRHLAEAPIERRAGRPHNPIDPARRLNPLRPASHEYRLAQLLVAQLNRTDLLPGIPQACPRRRS